MYTNNNLNSYISRRYREQLIAGYNSLIQERIELGAEAYFINFMFNHIPYGPERRLEVMNSEVARVHSRLMFHIVRKPEKESWRHLRPVFIGAPDLPVWKNKKVTSRSQGLNGGLHFNVIALTPKTAMPDMHVKFRNVLFGKQSRLTVPLQLHFQLCSRFYLNNELARIHVTPIIKGTMADYALKTFKKGLVSPDAVQVWC